MEEIPEIKQNNLLNLIKISLALIGVIIMFVFILVAYTHFSGKCLVEGNKSKSTEFICANKRKLSLLVFGNQVNTEVKSEEKKEQVNLENLENKADNLAADNTNKNSVSIWSKFTKFFSGDKKNTSKDGIESTPSVASDSPNLSMNSQGTITAGSINQNQQKQKDLGVDTKVSDDIKTAEANNSAKEESFVSQWKTKIVSLFSANKKSDTDIVEKKSEPKLDSVAVTEPAKKENTQTWSQKLDAIKSKIANLFKSKEATSSKQAADNKITETDLDKNQDRKSDSWWVKITKYFGSKKNADGTDTSISSSKDLSSGEKIAQLDTTKTDVANLSTATDASVTLNTSDLAKKNIDNNIDKKIDTNKDSAKSSASTAALPAQQPDAASTPAISENKDPSLQPVSAPPSLMATTAQTAAVPPPPPPKYETPALIVADNKMTITGPGAFRIKSIGYKAGQSFKKGDILMTFVCKEIEQDIAIQKEVLKQKKSIFENVQKLAKLNAASENSLVQAEADVAQVVKAIEKLEYQIGNQCIVKAEYSGKVISLTATEMQFVSVGQELMTINNNEALLIKAYIPVAWLEWLKIGSKFQFCYDAANCFEAALIRTGAEVDPASQTIDVFGKLMTAAVGNDKFVSGLSGQIEFNKP